MTAQRERSQNNPLNLGTFTRTSLRMLKGTLGPKSQVISGGYGRETYNHWFQVTLASVLLGLFYLKLLLL